MNGFPIWLKKYKYNAEKLFTVPDSWSIGPMYDSKKRAATQMLILMILMCRFLLLTCLIPIALCGFACCLLIRAEAWHLVWLLKMIHKKKDWNFVFLLRCDYISYKLILPPLLNIILIDFIFNRDYSNTYKNIRHKISMDYQIF